MTRMSFLPRAAVLLDAIEATWWVEGDLGLTVRRIISYGEDITSQTIYTYFGNVKQAITAADNRATDDLHHLAATNPTTEQWRHYAHHHPTRWLMAANGHGLNATTPQLTQTITHLQATLGGPARFAMINGLINAELRNQLDTDTTTTTLNQL